MILSDTSSLIDIDGVDAELLQSIEEHNDSIEHYIEEDKQAIRIMSSFFSCLYAELQSLFSRDTLWFCINHALVTVLIHVPHIVYAGTKRDTDVFEASLPSLVIGYGATFFLAVFLQIVLFDMRWLETIAPERWNPSSLIYLDLLQKLVIPAYSLLLSALFYLQTDHPYRLYWIYLIVIPLGCAAIQINRFAQAHYTPIIDRIKTLFNYLDLLAQLPPSQREWGHLDQTTLPAHIQHEYDHLNTHLPLSTQQLVDQAIEAKVSQLSDKSPPPALLDEHLTRSIPDHLTYWQIWGFIDSLLILQWKYERRQELEQEIDAFQCLKINLDHRPQS